MQGKPDSDQAVGSAGVSFVRSDGSGRRTPWPDVLVVVGLAVVAALAAALGFFHLAWRWGTAPVPISPIVLAAIVFVLSRAAHRLLGTLWSAVLPWFGCLAVIVFLYFARNPGRSLPLRVVTMNHETNEATDGDWRGLLLLGVLVLTAAAQLSLLWAASVAAAVARPRAPATEASRPSDPSVSVDPDPARTHVTPTTSGAGGDSSAPAGVDTGP